MYYLYTVCHKMTQSPAEKFKLIADSLLLDVGITGDEVYEPREENFMDEEEL